MILASSKVGDVVLDPFFGTGTTGAVAKKLRRHWVGIERDERYIDVAQSPPRRGDAGPARPRRSTSLPTSATGRACPLARWWRAAGCAPARGSISARTGKVAARIMANGTLRLGDAHRLHPPGGARPPAGAVQRLGALVLSG